MKNWPFDSMHFTTQKVPAEAYSGTAHGLENGKWGTAQCVGSFCYSRWIYFQDLLNNMMLLQIPIIRICCWTCNSVVEHCPSKFQACYFKHVDSYSHTHSCTHRRFGLHSQHHKRKKCIVKRIDLLIYVLHTPHKGVLWSNETLRNIRYCSFDWAGGIVGVFISPILKNCVTSQNMCSFVINDALTRLFVF